MGRVKRQSVPTEVDGNWQPAGDDATRGFLWTAQEYDWKGRVTRQINTNGTDKLISYEGCGCAGGQVTTVSGEQLAEGRRRQKVYEDILGRTFKSETLNWDGSVYSTSKTTFNGRDQVTLARQFAGVDGSGTFQDTTMTYDGYGRLKTQHRPEQDANTATVYNYYPDDRIQQVVDARGATVNYSYDNRGLTTQVSTMSPNPSVIPVTPTVSFVYDNLGNRTSMTDGLGTQTYEYNQLSQLTAETRSFTDSLPNAPMANNSFRLEYGYSISGQLKSVTDPYGQQISYGMDKVGRLNAVTGSSFAGLTNYASFSSYRAFGSVKGMSYGNGVQMSLNYNNSLQVSSFQLNGAQSIMNKNYDYYADGKLRYIQDLNAQKFDRLNIYDQVGRIKEAKSGAEATGQTTTNPTWELPYRQSYQFNTFNNLTQKTNFQWGLTSFEGQSYDLNYSYQNNRIIGGRTYDAEGQVVASTATEDSGTSQFDAIGHITHLTSTQSDAYRYFDGNGGEIKRANSFYQTQTMRNGTVTGQWIAEPLNYYIRSSVLGGEIISEADFQGKKLKTYVRASGSVLATQMVNDFGNYTDYKVNFKHWDAAGMSFRTTFQDGTQGYQATREWSPGENDPLGNNQGTLSRLF